MDQLTIPGSWIAAWVGNDMVVQPFGDKAEHAQTDENCPCQPQVEHLSGVVSGRVLTHNAFDGRD